jgi:hypothetical protein
MIQIFVKKIDMLTISIVDLIEIGDVIISKDCVATCISREGGGLRIRGEYLWSMTVNNKIFHGIIRIDDIDFHGYDREYEKDFKNLCARCYGEILVQVIVDGGTKILKFHSQNGAMREEEVSI